MCTKSGSILAVVVVCGILVFAAGGVCQQAGNSIVKEVGLRPRVAQQRPQNEPTRRQRLQANAKTTLADEEAREREGACKDANTTVEFNTCFGKQAEITESNLKAFEEVIAELGDPDPEAPDHPAGNGISGPSLSPKQQVAEFRSVEQSWRKYRDAACTAAVHQFDGGTGGPSFGLQCEMRLDRSHMRELDMIYRGDLNL